MRSALERCRGPGAALSQSGRGGDQTDAMGDSKAEDCDRGGVGA
jgi:hypothetical protein